jgi:hypothetical protein
MAMDFETVRFMRIAFAIIFAGVGAAAGIKYGDFFLGTSGHIIGPIAGVIFGVIIGWNTVDLIKGRPHK